MRFFIGQWLVFGILLGILVVLWENIVDPLSIGLFWKLWLLAVLGWLISNLVLLLLYWICLSLMTQKEGKLTRFNLLLWAIAHTCYDMGITLTSKLFLHRVPSLFVLKLYGLKCGKGFSLAIGVEFGDPDLIVVGDNCRLGAFTILSGHFLEKNSCVRKKVVLKNNIEIGARVLVGPGVYIEENVIIGGMSFVPKDVRLEKNAIYAGAPARKISDLPPIS